MATTLAWNAVGEHDSLRVTCTTGHTSRQNLWPDEKQLYEPLCHSARNSVVRSSRPGSTGGATATVSGWASHRSSPLPDPGLYGSANDRRRSFVSVMCPEPPLESKASRPCASPPPPR